MKEHSTASWHIGLLVLRVGIGVMFVFHGYPKLLGGPQSWEGLGAAMGGLGITFAPAFWGFCAAMSETLGGLMLIAGIFVRVVSLFLGFTMFVATIMHLQKGDGLMGASHAIENGIFFLSLIIMGAGSISLDQWLKKRNASKRSEKAK